MNRKTGRSGAALSGAALFGAALFGVGAALTAPALAQKAVGKPPVSSILRWTPQQQLDRYKAIEDVYEVRTIAKGEAVSPLPMAATQIDPVIAGRSVERFMKDHKVTGLIAIKDGEIVLEKYGEGRKPEDRWTSFSVAKSMTATLIGAAIKDRWINGLGDPVTMYIPELKGSGYDGVNIRDLLTMSSGVKWNEDYTDPRSDVSRAGAGAYDGKTNPLVAYMAKLPSEAEPGSKFVYKTGETDLAGIVLSRALAGKSISQYASEKIWAPFGMERDAIWMVDQAGHERGGCCMSMTLRDYGRIGLFMLGGGKIGDRQVVPAGWTDEATTNRLSPEASARGASYGYFWWSREAPNYEAIGIFGQGIAVFPEDGLVIALNSAMPRASDRKQSEAKAALFAAIREAAAK
ncbi:MAG: serine hydrolase [Alphaproteobacteria bacterium]|nr:serine hydrolase [Alphaproteobacteria bacterium]